MLDSRPTLAIPPFPSASGMLAAADRRGVAEKPFPPPSRTDGMDVRRRDIRFVAPSQEHGVLEQAIGYEYIY